MEKCCWTANSLVGQKKLKVLTFHGTILSPAGGPRRIKSIKCLITWYYMVFF